MHEALDVNDPNYRYSDCPIPSLYLLLNTTDRSMVMRKLLSDFFLAVGTVFSLSPILLYWFIHGSYERYIWMIHQSYPLSAFGGGPFQMVLGLGLLLLGVSLLGIGWILRSDDATH